MGNPSRSRLNWRNVTTLTHWLRRMTRTSLSSRNDVASWWTINTFNLTSTKSQATHVAVASCCSRRTPRSRETSWKRVCPDSWPSRKRLRVIPTTPCSTYLLKKTGIIRRNSAIVYMVSCTSMAKMTNAHRGRLINKCAKVIMSCKVYVRTWWEFTSKTSDHL